MRMHRRRSGVLLVLALGAACLQDAPSAPTAGAASLAMETRVVRAATSLATGIDVLVQYERRQGGPVTLLQRQIPFASDGAAGASGQVVQPLGLDLSRCLADPQHLPAAGQCSLTVRVSLVAGSGVLDEVSLPGLSVSPGRTVTPPPVTLYEVATLAITPPRDPTLFPGETTAFSAQLLAADGTPVSGREVTWTSSSSSVAAVAGGNVTAAGLGSATITASAGGRSASRAVTVVPRPQLLLSDTLADVATVFNSQLETLEPPPPTFVTISNATATPATGLSVGTILYQGGAAGWLTATLAGTTAPTTATIIVTRTDLLPGTYSAKIPILASSATANSPQFVTVNYTVADDGTSGGGGPPSYSLFFTLDSLNGGQLPLGSVTSTPGLVANVQYGPGISGWLQTTIITTTSPPTVVVQPLPSAPPGNHQAVITVSSPTTPPVVIGSVQFVVDYTGFTLGLLARVQGQARTTVRTGEVLDIVATMNGSAGTVPGIPVTFKVLDPGLNLVGTSSVTGHAVQAVPVPGARGPVRVVVSTVFGSPPSTDTLTIFVDNGAAGSLAVPDDAPSLPVLRRSPNSPPPAFPERR